MKDYVSIFIWRQEVSVVLLMSRGETLLDIYNYVQEGIPKMQVIAKPIRSELI